MRSAADIRTSRRSRRSGLTLVEVMCASAIAAMLVAMMISGYIFQNRAMNSQNLMNDTQQNARAAMEMIGRDLAMAGYGITAEGSRLDAWIPWVSGMVRNPMVYSNASSDRIVIAAAFGAPAGLLASAVTNGTTVIQLEAGQGAAFQGARRRVAFIGKMETVRITSVFGDTLTISTDPLTTRGLRNPYLAGSPVEIVSTVTYEQRNPSPGYFPYEPHLLRWDSMVNYGYDWQAIAAGNIETLHAAYTATDNSLNLTVTARSPEIDTFYTHPDVGDQYRRFTLTRLIHPRNARLKL